MPPLSPFEREKRDERREERARKRGDVITQSLTRIVGLTLVTGAASAGDDASVSDVDLVVKAIQQVAKELLRVLLTARVVVVVVCSDSHTHKHTHAHRIPVIQAPEPQAAPCRRRHHRSQVAHRLRRCMRREGRSFVSGWFVCVSVCVDVRVFPPFSVTKRARDRVFARQQSVGRREREKT